MNDLMKVVAAGFAAVAVVAAIALGAWFLLNPDGFSDRFDEVNLVAVNTAVGVLLICAGLALAVVGFVTGAVLNVAPKKESTAAAAGIDLPDAMKALTDLLKQAGGLGVAVMLLGVILLTGTALSDASMTPSTNGANQPTASPR